MIFLETLYWIYSTPGFNIAHVDVTAALCKEHDIDYEDVERIEAVVNWLETEYPSAAFPSRSRDPRPDSPHYYSAWGVVRRSFPLLKCVQRNVGEEDPAEVLELMNRVEIIPSHRRTLFGPKITIHLKDGQFHKISNRHRVYLGFSDIDDKTQRDCSRTSHFRGAIRRACCSVSWIG